MNKHRIVLTDDHEMFRAGLKSLINKESVLRVVGEAKDGEELLLTLKSLKCDLIVLDISMPNMDGISAMKTLRKRFPEIKILVLTMQKDPAHFKHTMLNGASGYVLKEDAYEQLVMAIKMVIKGKRFISPSIESMLAERYIRSLDDEQTPSLEILTPRERQILQCIAAGLANKNIATKLKISIRTAETHRSNLTGKLGIKTTAGLVKYAISKGLT